MSYSAFVQSNFLKRVATISSFVFISVFLLNPSLYTDMIKKEYVVSANFVANDYASADENYVIESSLSDLEGIDEMTDESELDNVAGIISYTVRPKDLIGDVAKKYNISIEQLKTLNNILDNELLVGQKLYITPTPGFIYKVKEKTSLMVFSNMYNINKDSLLEANNQPDDMAPYEAWDIILVPNKTLTQAYELWLLKKPEPTVIVAQQTSSSTPRKIVVWAKPASTLSSTTTTSSKWSIVSSWKQSISDIHGFARGYCTDYAAHKAKFAFPVISGNKRFRSRWGNANQRYANAKAKWFKTSSKPSVGAIGVFRYGGAKSYSAGHVVIVESVDRDNKKIKVSDMNYSGRSVVTVRRIQMDETMTKATSSKQWLMWFIPVQSLPESLQKQYDELKW